ncbi:MAG: glucose-6-phosphate isomerase [Acidobacteria bacterium]|nr:glucose-6-phosphate isomerase [Acidobacteriota bacterium]
MRRQDFARRFWAKDATLWKRDKKAVEAIRQRLGWLFITQAMRRECPALVDFARQVREAGFTHAVLLGMGGSSLGSEVCRQTFGVASGFLDLSVLDSTDPGVIRRLESNLPLEKTLFLVSTKSGTTTETLCFFRYFFEKVRQHKGERAGENFVAITDSGTPLVSLAAEKQFRRTFLNPSDIGGRFSVLSYFGLVPAALLGVDIGRLLERAAQWLPTAGSRMATEENPAMQLGALLGELGLIGRDKVTFFLSPSIASFGTWVEQLIAESTGKEGKGLLPIVGEPPAEPAIYGPDRVFIHIRLRSSADGEISRRLVALEAAGHPVIRIEMNDLLDLGTEFFRWEMATAVAASVQRTNPFDEPNVKESKDNTSRLLRQFELQKQIPEPAPLLRESGIRLYGDARAKALLRRRAAHPGGRRPRLRELLAAHCRQAKAGDYLALLAYIPPAPQPEKALQQLRLQVREAVRAATCLGYGPRYLHSTGQFHKGGAPKGIFVEITADNKADLPIPGLPYTFGLLQQAQALGDLEALQSRKRPILRLHLEGSAEKGLRQLVHWMQSAFPMPKEKQRRKR